MNGLLHLKTLLIKHIRFLAFLAYGVSLLVSANVFAVPQASLSLEEHDISVEACDISNNTSAQLPISSKGTDDEHSTGKIDICAGGCKYLLGYSFDCIKSSIITISSFFWKFHYQSPHRETLSDPPRVCFN